jgi:Raf kinase inhibitor-like YbhB/YbcL family protein
MKLYLTCLLLLVFLLPAASHALDKEPPKTDNLKISSPAFLNKGDMPGKYTCDGENVNPSLRIENVPPEAKSLALVFDDMDAPRGTYVHWILWNIAPGTREIKENSVPEGAIQGTNDFKKQSYGGPCPPTRAHRYVLRVYTLDIRLQLDPSSTKTDLEKAMAGHVIAKAEITTRYKRKK